MGHQLVKNVKSGPASPPDLLNQNPHFKVIQHAHVKVSEALLQQTGVCISGCQHPLFSFLKSGYPCDLLWPIG